MYPIILFYGKVTDSPTWKPKLGNSLCKRASLSFLWGKISTYSIWPFVRFPELSSYQVYMYIYYMLTFLFLSRLGLLLCLRITGTASPSTSSFFWPFSSSSSSLSPPSPLHSLTWLSEEERWGGERGDNLLPGSLLLAGPFGLVFVSWKGDVNARKLWSMQTVCIYSCMCKYN